MVGGSRLDEDHRGPETSTSRRLPLPRLTPSISTSPSYLSSTSVALPRGDSSLKRISLATNSSMFISSPGIVAPSLPIL